MTPSLPAAPSPGWPEDGALPPVQAAPSPEAPQDTGPQITALSGNRAALTLLVVQNVVSAFAMGVWVPLGANGQAVRLGLGLPLGTALLLSFAVTVLVALTAFKGAMARCGPTPAGARRRRGARRWRPSCWRFWRRGPSSSPT